MLFISLWNLFHRSFTLLFISFYWDDFELSSSVSLTTRMDETRIDDHIDDTYQEDGSADDCTIQSYEVL